MLLPDRRRDDTLLHDLFSKSGEKTALAQLMGVEPENVSMQLDPNNKRKSFFHCAKLVLTAAYHFDKLNGGNRGETLWRDLCAWRERLRGKAAPTVGRFPSRLAYQVIERECNTPQDELELVPVGDRLRDYNQLIDELSACRDRLAAENDGYYETAAAWNESGGGQGQTRVAGEGSTQPTRPAATNGRG